MDVFRQRRVAKKVVRILAIICLTGQKIVCHVSHEDMVIIYLQRSFSALVNKEEGNRTDGGHKKICGEDVETSGNLAGMNLMKRVSRVLDSIR